ncbi:MAG: hypothetical protein LBC72_01455 [Spirochaetaceae bacterium]|jgi:ABC-type nickel/cobalt efflux system permease component RcnA|nr:hypothetical protein [Spirochaetaceae bacterium]
MKHIILVLIVLIAMFTFWRTIGSSLSAGEHKDVVQTEILSDAAEK